MRYGRIHDEPVVSIRAARSSSGISVVTYFIATVWMHQAGHENEASTRQVIKLPAATAADYRAEVVALWPGKVITFGPIGESKVQA
jgi:hypothetical protein